MMLDDWLAGDVRVTSDIVKNNYIQLFSVVNLVHLSAV